MYFLVWTISFSNLFFFLCQFNHCLMMITPPTPNNNVVWATWPKTRDQKVTLNSNYFTYLCPLTYDSKQFHRAIPSYIHTMTSSNSTPIIKSNSHSTFAQYLPQRRSPRWSTKLVKVVFAILISRLHQLPFPMTPPISTSYHFMFLRMSWHVQLVVT